MKSVDNQPKKNGGITGKGFMPGKSGNPAGRPKIGLCFTDRLREAVNIPLDKKRIVLDDIIAKVVTQARAGNLIATQMIVNRLEGKELERIITREAEKDELIIE
jgi:hypothetical protein